ncbi:RNA-binding region-containing protein 3-like [Watersipora subatra]|uniref:RNA-binding region-containing protein 3-like n=1 Tax=Watersipora subatra TaxID=2589382 RepID=UPI00355C5F62
MCCNTVWQENTMNSGNSKTLVVRNLPPTLSDTQVRDLFLLFKATSVRHMGNHGRMRHSAFVSFLSETDATHALKQLHQLSVLNFVLRAEYAKSQQPVDEPKSKELLLKTGFASEVAQSKATEQTKNVQAQPDLVSQIDSISKTWRLDYTADDSLTYSYPPPTETTLKNIIHCMASVPKFYNQVLHLMNKMHLPPPFGELTTAPPLSKDVHAETANPAELVSEESELESSEEESNLTNRKRIVRKRVMNTPADIYIKRLRSQLALNETKTGQGFNRSKESGTSKPSSVQDAFEVVREQAKQVKVNLPTQVSLPTKETTGSATSESYDAFGKMESQQAPADQVETEEIIAEDNNGEEQTTSNPFITFRELKAGRLTEIEQAEHSILKKHTAGEPRERLYIKNLAKQTTEANLKYIFGRYVNWNDEQEAEAFNIRHMTEGRMKGQAFVTLPNVEAAEAALLECHAFVLNGKPMAVAYSAPKS